MESVQTFKVGDVVRFLRGTTQYDVTEVDIQEQRDSHAMLWPRSPQDRVSTHTNAAGQWVQFGMLEAVPADQVIDYTPMPVSERRDNSESDVWTPTRDPMTQAEVNDANGYYGWTKFRLRLPTN